MSNHTDEQNQNKREMIIQIQRFTASSISMLNLSQTACIKQNSEELSKKEHRSVDRFMTTSQKFIDNIKDNAENFECTRFVKKAFTALRSENACKMLLEKNPALFSMRDDDDKIITILPGIDMRVGFKYFDEPQAVSFWQYMHLFSSSVFNMIKSANHEKFKKYQHNVDTLEEIEKELSKTGVMFNDRVFNPFIGVGEEHENYGVNEMFTGGALPNKHKVSIESVLNMLGVDKMIDENKLNEQLKGVGEEQVNEATEKIASMLNASNNPEVKEVCSALIRDIVLNLKENGINNIGDTLRSVAENAKGKLELSKMRKTAESMKDFMANGQERMKDLKDQDGKPIGQQLLNSLAVPMSMMNTMNMGPPDASGSDQTSGEKALSK